MSVPVAMIPYANMAPYRELGAPEGCHFVPLVPTASIEALMMNRVVAAAVPVGGLMRLEGMVETVGRFGIAARGPCMSVLLFSRVPFEKMQAPATLRITDETASSVRLLYLLLGRTLGFDRLPQLAAAGRQPDAELLIGDRALIQGMGVNTETGEAGAENKWSHVTDLSQKWFDIHGLPFVFARWAVRKDAASSLKTAIARWLDEFKAQESELVARAVPRTARALDFPLNLIERYFGVIRRSLDASDIQGQRRFFKEIEKFGKQPLFR